MEGEDLLAVPVQPVQPMGMARSVCGAKVYRREERCTILKPWSSGACIYFW